MDTPRGDSGSGSGSGSGSSGSGLVQVGPYRIAGPIGRGAMGAVFRAEHEETGAEVALKCLLDPADEDYAARFQREAEILARIDEHPGIVRVHASGVHEGRPWYAMELVQGSPLSDVIAEKGALPHRRAAALMIAIAQTVQHAHRHGVLHRDLKPSNVLIELATGKPRVLDFGLARDLRSHRLTRTGDIIGTPRYMAPEQVAPGSGAGQLEVGPRTDVYGLGALLYACLTGRDPFEGKSASVIMIDVVSRDPAPPRKINPRVPVTLEAICLRAMEKVPGHRYDSADALARDLSRYLRGEAVSASSTITFGRVIRRFSRSRKRSAIAASVFIALASFLALAVTYGTSFTSAPLPDRIAALEAALDGGASVGAEAAALAGEAADAPGLARRCELLAVVSTLVEADDAADGASEAAARLAELVRPGGGLDGERLRRADAALARADRFAALLHLHYGAAPVSQPSPRVALAVATRVARREVGFPFPEDDDAVRALLEVPGLEEADRARLLVARGEAALRQGWFEPALAAFLEAFHAVGELPDAGAWPEQFHDFARDAFLDTLETDAARAGRLLDLLVRTDGDVHELAPELVAAQQRGLAEAAGRLVLGGPASEAGSDDGERVLLVASFLERFASSPLGREFMRDFGGISIDWLVARGEREQRRPAAVRNPAVLLTIARLIHYVPGRGSSRSRGGLAAPIVDAAAETGVRALWFFAQVAWLVEWSTQDRRAALPWAERALELDRSRPDDRRWPFVAERLADIVADLQTKRWAGVDDPDPAELRRAAALACEAWRVQHAVEPRLAAIREAGGSDPWPLARHFDAGRQVYEVAESLVALGAGRCCAAAGGANETALDALIRVGLEARPGNEMRGLLLRVHADHELVHGRAESALAAATESVALQRAHLADREGPRWYDWENLNLALERRGVALREAGQLDEAIAHSRSWDEELEAYPERRRGDVWNFWSFRARAAAGRARCLERRGELEAAAAAYDEAWKLFGRAREANADGDQRQPYAADAARRAAELAPVRDALRLKIAGAGAE